MAIEYDGQSYECLWASDVDFDGIRFEVRDAQGADVMEIASGEDGTLTLTTWRWDVPVGLIEECLRVVRAR